MSAHPDAVAADPYVPSIGEPVAAAARAFLVIACPWLQLVPVRPVGRIELQPRSSGPGEAQSATQAPNGRSGK